MSICQRLPAFLLYEHGLTIVHAIKMSSFIPTLSPTTTCEIDSVKTISENQVNDGVKRTAEDIVLKEEICLSKKPKLLETSAINVSMICLFFQVFLPEHLTFGHSDLRHRNKASYSNVSS